MPSFNNILGELHGFQPEKGVKPHPKNLKAFEAYIFSNVYEECTGCADTWDEVFSELERSMAFWKAYFCGIQ